MTSVGPLQLLIIFLIVLILFGAGKLPQVGKQLGSAINEFRSSVKTDEQKSDDTVDNTVDNKEADSPQH